MNQKLSRRRPVDDARAILRLDASSLIGRPIPFDNHQRRLVDAIARYGITHPLSVCPEGEGKFRVLDGARRLAAARNCGIEVIPCLLEADGDPISLDGDMFTQAERLRVILERRGWTQQEAASRLGISQSTVANKLRLLKLSESEREAVLRLGLRERHARAMLALPAERRGEVLAEIERRGLTVAATEALIEQMRRQICRPTAKGAIRDIGIFYNSIDRALSILHEAGINATIARDERPDGVIVTIHVSRETSA